MIKIRTKLLIAFTFGILLLSLGSIYAFSYSEKLSATIYKTTVYKEAVSDIVLHYNSIDNILTLYSVAEEKGILALEYELDFSMSHIHHALDELRDQQTVSEYVVELVKKHDEIMDVSQKIISFKKEQLKVEKNFAETTKKARDIRYELKDAISGGSIKLKMDYAQMGYEDKEYNFQYKDNEHSLEWLSSIDVVEEDLRKEKIVSAMPLIDGYRSLAEDAIKEINDITDLNLKKQYYLIQLGNDFIDNNIVLSKISKISQDELEAVINKGKNQKAISFGIILASLVLGGIIVFAVSRNINRSLEELVKVARRVSEGDLRSRADIKSDDEAGYLAKIFNQMLGHIERSEKDLKEEGNRMRSIVSSMNEGLVVVDKSLNVILVNGTAEKLLGVSSKKIVGLSLAKVVKIIKKGKELSTEEWPVSQVMSNGQPININIKESFYYKVAGGRTFPVEMAAASFVDSESRGAVIIFRDVTDLKQADEEREYARMNLESVLKSIYIERDMVQEQKNKLEAILNSIGDAVFAVDKNRRVIIFNPAAEKITGFGSEEVKSRIYSDKLKFMNEVTREERMDSITGALAGKTVEVNNHTILKTKEGNTISIEANAAPIKNNREEIIGCIVVFRDITAKKELERMRYEFISIASHQLRTPLSAMKWFLEILLNGDVGALKPKQKEVLKETFANNQSMISLINQMLYMSRVESDRLVINPETFNLYEEVAKAIKEAEPFIEKKNQKFKFGFLKDKKLHINADKNLLKNIIMNLLVNSSKYTPSGGKIVLSVKKDKNESLLFKVEDNGIGIPHSEYYKIFKKFSRASNAITYEASGTGLGLYIVRSIVGIMGGKVWFESEEGKGTSFFFTLPIDSVFCNVNEDVHRTKKESLAV